MKGWYLSFVFGMGLLACKKPDKPVPDAMPVRPVPSGQIVRVHCLKDTFFSYTVYVPRLYSEDRQWPVMYFLDPHGRGLLPVKKYQALADTYGYILIASNDSRNRQPYEYGRRIFESLRADAARRWKVHPYRQYLCGFSGGARLAGRLWHEFPELAGMIGCGAGWDPPPAGQAPRVSVALGGKKDFNLLELRAMETQVDSASFLLIEFDGQHEWPETQAMRWAWDWIETNAMRQRLIPTDSWKIESIHRRHREEIARARENRLTGEQVLLYRRLIRMLVNLDDIREQEEILSDLERLRRTHDYFQSRRLAMREEKRYREKYAQAINREAFLWWKTEIRRLRETPKEKNREEYRLMHERLLQWISILAYQFTRTALDQKQTEESDRLLKIYRLADPDNPAVFYLLGLHHLLTEDRTAALSFLQKSADMGYSDTEGVEDEPLLNALRTDKAFAAVIQQIQANANNTK